MTIEQDGAIKFRCRFEKTGPIRFISHLDLTRAFHRAFHRALIPLKHSEGFSPHPKFAFALPLSVGTESLAEWADFTLKEGFKISPEKLLVTLQEQMPAGIRITKIGEQKEKFSEIAFASYTVLLPAVPPEAVPEMEQAIKGDMVIQKKNKKGKWVEKNLSGGIHSLSFFPEEKGVRIECILCAAGENYLKPESVLSYFSDKLPCGDFSQRSILRREVLRRDMTIFE